MDLDDAAANFRRANRHCDNLITVHRGHGGPERGRRDEEVSINRAVVVLTVASWQAVVQDLDSRLHSPERSCTRQSIIWTVYGEHHKQSAPIFEPFRRALPRYTVVNCWHMNEGESAAMWRLYLKSGEGVAVRSTFRRLTESFKGYEPSVYVGVVKYVDYEHDWIPEANSFEPFIHKRRSFEHEREVRAVRQDLVYGSGGADLEAERFPDGGEAVPVDLDTLIERVYVAPGAPAWLRDLVEAVGSRYGLRVETVQSSLDADPVY